RSIWNGQVPSGAGTRPCGSPQGHDVLFMTQTRLLGALRNAQAVGSYERRFQALAKVPLLIMDNFGLKPMRTPQDEDFHDPIAERYERTSTVLTSNLDFTEWGDAFATNKMLGAATLDRPATCREPRRARRRELP